MVVSNTQVHGGDAYNVLPNTVVLRGTVRAFHPDARAGAEPALRRIVDGACAMTGATAEMSYERQYPTLVNDEGAAERALAAAARVFETVEPQPSPTMIVEDFAFLLEHRPGRYGWIGNGPDIDGRILHSAWYDFNDEALPYGASWFVEVARAKR